jgi:hypothetical protein
MRGRQLNTLWRSTAVGGLGALLFTYGCGAAQNTTGLRAADAAGSAAGMPISQAGMPIIVSCEPGQRTLVRPVIVNGAAVSQVECVSNGEAVGYASPTALPATPAAVVPASYRYSAPDPRDGVISDPRIVPASYPAATARARPARQIVYEEDRPVRVKRGRSVKKSAIVIGSSAGVGAGVGAAVGGKKGALIGAAIGGGGAALWDQITRRKN